MTSNSEIFTNKGNNVTVNSSLSYSVLSPLNKYKTSRRAPLKQILTIICFFFTLNSSIAQNKQFQISGQVQDQSGEPLTGALISLQNQADSSIIIGAFTDHSGQFILTPSTPGTYKIHFSFVGQQGQSEDLQLKVEQLNYDLGTITLSSKVLESIEIKTQRQTLKKLINKTVFTIENSIFAKGENGISLLNIIPDINLNPSGGLSYRGNQPIVVFLNDRKLNLRSASQLNTYLSSIPSETIKEIEIIPFPGARYDIQGSQVVINIRTKNKQFKAGKGELVLI